MLEPACVMLEGDRVSCETRIKTTAMEYVHYIQRKVIVGQFLCIVYHNFL